MGPPRAGRGAREARAAAAAAAAAVAAAVVAGIAGAEAGTAFAGAAGAPCGPGLAFDAAGLECRACPEGQVPAASGSGCECAAGSVPFYVPAPTGAPAATLGAAPALLSDPLASTSCRACSLDGKGASRSGNYCVTCDGSAGNVDAGVGASAAWYPAVLDAASGQCVCAAGAPAGAAVVETDGHGLPLLGADGGFVQRCVPCPGGATAVGGECPTCPYPKVLGAGGACACPADDALPAGVRCFEDGEEAMATRVGGLFQVNLQGYSTVNLYNVVAGDPKSGSNSAGAGAAASSPTAASQASTTVSRSKAFDGTLLASALECYDSGDRAACARLGNLCVLAMYNDENPACKVYQEIQSLRSGVQYHEAELKPAVGWSYTLPWLFLQGLASYHLGKDDVVLSTSFVKGSPGSTLNFVLAESSLGGDWLGYANMTSQLQLCGGHSSMVSSWQRVGGNYKNECSLTLSQIRERAGGARGPKGSAGAKGTYFFDLHLQDANGKLYPIPVKNLGLRSGPAAINTNPVATDDSLVRRFFMVDVDTAVPSETGELEAVRYASSVKMVVPVRKNSLLPPYLELTYSTVLVGSVGPAQPEPTFPASFEVLYVADQSVFWTSMDTIIIVGAVLAGVFWLLQMYAFVRRRQETPMDLRSVTMALVSGGGAAATMSFVVLTCVSAYWLFFFKLSDNVHSMLPHDGEIGLVRDMLYAAVILQSLDVAMEIYRQVNADIFFIDWEKPRRVMLPGGSGEDEAPVSVWRVLFIANQWGDYQARRLTSPTLTILFMVFFLGGIHLEHLGYVMPGTSREYHEFLESSLLLRMGLSALLMLALFAGQGIFMVWIYHRYVKNPMEDFVDLCFLAKVSVVILSEDFAGYYLHGRNRMPFADTNMSDINKELQKEVDMNVGPRGLLANSEDPALSDNQTFQIYIPRTIRDKYNSTLLNRIQDAAFAQRGRSGVLSMSQRGPGHVADDTDLKAKHRIEEDFVNMIADVESNPSKQVRNPQFVERLMGMPPELGPGGDKAIFQHDMFSRFKEVLFYGIEAKLVVWNILIFLAVDSSSRNPAVAGLVAWALNFVAVWVRESFGKENLSKKSLIDGRFLL